MSSTAKAAASRQCIQQIDASALPARRLFSVHLLTPRVFDEYRAGLDAFIVHYYSRTSNHTVVLVTPLQHLNEAATFLQRLGGTTHAACTLPPPHARTLHRYFRGVHFVLHGVSVSVPSKYAAMQATCNGRNWTRDYAIYSGAFFVAQLIWEELLDRCDFYVKMDTDVTFLRPMPYDLAARLAEMPRAVIVHTGFDPGVHRRKHHPVPIPDRTTCERGILQALRSYRKALGASSFESFESSDTSTAAMSTRGAAAEMAPWCEQGTGIPEVFYGNFVAYRAAFMRSEAVLSLSRHLYYEVGEGYFEWRWGDQASPVAFVCHMLPAVSLTGGDERVVLLDNLRNHIFRHGRKKAATGKGAKKKVATTKYTSWLFTL